MKNTSVKSHHHRTKNSARTFYSYFPLGKKIRSKSESSRIVDIQRVFAFTIFSIFTYTEVQYTIIKIHFYGLHGGPTMHSFSDK